MAASAERIMALFSGHRSAHGTHGQPKRETGKLKWEIKSTARTLREEVTVELWEKHLSGDRPLGIIPIDEDGSCLWGSIDVDVYDDDMMPIVKKVQSLPIVPCRSKSGGLHLFMFLSDPQPAGDVQITLREIAATLGLAGSEIFPKQTHVLSDRGDLGNWMVMPYFGSTYGGKIQEQVGIKKTGSEMTIEEFLRTAEKARVTSSEFEKIGERDSSKKKEKEAGLFTDGPPCLQHMAASGFPEGGRNNALFMIGVYLRKRFPSDWQNQLEKCNQDYMLPPLTSEEIVSCVRSLERRDYEYTCRNEPMVSHCDSLLCKTRKHGVGDDGHFPTISGLSKLDTDPPIWFVDMGGHRLEVTTDQLYNYPMINKACMEVSNQCFLVMRQDTWVKMVSRAMNDLVIIETSPEVGFEGRFMEHLEDFLTNRQRGTRKEDLLSGRPWEDEDKHRHYFRLKDIQRHLEREKVRDERGHSIGRNRITRMITRAGGEHTFFSIRGRGVNVWWVPSEAIEETPDVPPPPLDEEAI